MKNIIKFLESKGESIKDTDSLTDNQIQLVESEFERIEVNDNMGKLEQKVLLNYVKQGCYLTKIENGKKVTDTSIKNHLIVGIDGDIGEIYARAIRHINLEELKTLYRLRKRLALDGIG